MSVKRYDMKEVYKGRMAVVETGAGAFVTHGDYAVLEQKLTDMAVQLANAESNRRELAAELSAVDKIHNEAVFITDDHYEQCPPEVQKMIRSLAVLQIPAYDAFLAEVRAQGVEMFAQSLHVSGKGKHLYSEIAEKFAAQLRKGAAL
ncbi:TPA: hypothetical protein ACNUZQ_002112 [Citrobacter braakii]